MTDQNYESQISREISKRNLKPGINNECRKCLRILRGGCDGRASATPCLGFLDWEKYGEVRV